MKLKYFFKSPRLFAYGILIATAKLWPDKLYLKCYYWLINGRNLNLDNPLTFNEKLNWMKLNYHNKHYFELVDKYDVKSYVQQIIGEEYVVPNYGVWEKFDEIDFSKLPDTFVLKCTHDSGGAFICKNRETFDKDFVGAKLTKNLARRYFFPRREWVYKKVNPRIIADMYLDDGTGSELRDFKFWCFNGEPKVMYITNKGKDIKENFYDMDFNVLDINHGFPRAIPEYEKPQNFELMKTLAARLSFNIPFVRVDFFDVNGRVYFGEFTFYDWAGMKAFNSERWETRLGEWITLPLPMYD